MEEQSFQQRERLVEEITGYKFKNPDLLHQAFTHPSVPQNWASNDRMEYLGDSVLSLMIAKEHYFAYPDLSSKDLTDLRSVNVDTEKLARVGIKYNLHNHLRCQIQSFNEQVEEFRSATLEYPLHSLGCINPPKVLADIVEALIAAIYIDCNFSIDITWQVILLFTIHIYILAYCIFGGVY
uniref:Ribonuclease 3 3 n=1 Tax=Solanum tuberosum TaxID=4113 RepID=M0ZJ48_SOLTU